jgi:hypothetical protein
VERECPDEQRREHRWDVLWDERADLQTDSRGRVISKEFPNLNHVARGLGLGVTPLESVGRT